MKINDDQQFEHTVSKDDQTSDQGSKSGTPQHDGITDDTQIELENLKLQLGMMTETAKRTMADMQNMKRRQDDERSKIYTMANAELILALLPSIDSLNRAKQHIPEGAQQWAKGIEMCIDQIEKTLKEYGLTEMKTLGEPFNPNLHEAITAGTGEKDTVIEEFEKGYTLGDKILRHAKVKVGNGE